MTRILFRTDGSPEIGAGHLVRCATLAVELHRRGCEVCLATSVGSGSAGWALDLFPGDIHPLDPSSGLDDGGGPVSHASCLSWSQADDANATRQLIDEELGARPAWIVVDHYGLDARWHRAMSAHCHDLLVIDDLADRELHSSMVLDQNRAPDAGESAYRRVLTSPDGRILSGPEWSLVRAAFLEGRRDFRPPPVPPRVLLMSGGSDVGGLASECLKELSSLDFPVHIDVITGSSEVAGELERKTSVGPHQTLVHLAPEEPARIMAEADVAISAAGSTTWELCCLGVPSMLVQVAENQAHVLDQAVQAGAADRLELSNLSAVRAFVTEALHDHEHLRSMRHAGQELVDGMGASRVADLLLEE